MLKMCDVCEGKGTIGEEVCAQCNGTGNVHVRGKKRTGRIVSYGEDAIRWDMIPKSDTIDLSWVNVDDFIGFRYNVNMKENLLTEIENAILAQKNAGFDYNAMFVSYKLYSKLLDYATFRFAVTSFQRFKAFMMPTIYGRYALFHDREDGLILFVNIKKEEAIE